MPIKEDLLNDLSEILEVDSILSGSELLSDLAGWDSVAIISVIAMMDEHLGITLPASEISRCKTVEDLLALAESRGS